MTPLVYAFLLGSATLVSAFPVIDRRTVTSLDQAAVAEAQPRDDTATRAFSSVPITACIPIFTSDGQCLFVDPLSGDFRENLTPIQVAACDGSQAQTWDVITAGKHNNAADSALVVSGLTNACFNFDPRRAAGNQVLLFSCGGRADGGGLATNSQLFSFSGGAGPLALTPENAAGSCLTVKGAIIDVAACNSADPNQSFTFGGSAASVPAASAPVASVPAASAPVASVPATSAPAASAPVACSAPSTVTSVVTSVVTSTVFGDGPAATTTEAAVSDSVTVSPVSTAVAVVSSVSSAPIITTSAPAAPATTATTANPSVIAVSRAGVVLNPSAAAESNPRDNTATRAFTGASIKSSSGQCLFIDPTAGDFRENLIPIVLQPCDGSINQQWDFITAGVHNNAPDSTLIVSSLTQGCMNFDPRRAAGDTVIMFSCGGRADGGGLVTNSQLFTFTAGESSLQLQPENGNGQICFAENAAGRLDQVACSSDPAQVFTIG